MRRAHARGLVPPSPLLRHTGQTQTGMDHQPRHPVQAGRLAFVAQFLVHAWRTHHAIAGGMVPTDLLQQAGVVLGTLARRARRPLVKAAG